MPTGPLPPERWLHDAVWGRDAVHFQNGDEDRISIPGLYDDDDEASSVIFRIVKFHLFGEVMKHITNGDKEIDELIFARNAQEIPAAFLLSNFIYDNRRAYIISSSDLSSSPSTRIGDLALDVDEHHAFYVEIDNIPGTTLTGDPIRGFLISTGKSEELGSIINIMPMGDKMEFGFISPEPTFIISAKDPNKDLASLMQEWPEDNIEAIEDFRERSGVYGEPNDIAFQNAGYQMIDPATRQSVRAFSTRMHAGYISTAKRFDENSETAARIMSEHAADWAKIVASAIEIVTQNKSGKTAYPTGADPKLVSKALSNGTGARKAMQRLATAGYRPVTAFGDAPCEMGSASLATTPAPAPTKSAEPAPKVTSPKRDAPAERVDPRKAKREKRNGGPRKIADAPTSKAPAVDKNPVSAAPGDTDQENANPNVDVSTGSDTVASDEATGPLRTSDTDLQGAEIMRRAFRDLPKVGPDGWRSAIASAASNNASRRLRITTAPRESEEAARKRIASGIDGRIENFDEFEEFTHTSAIQTWSIDKPSTMRPPEVQILEEIDEPIAVILTEFNPDIASMIAFPGITPGSAHHESEKPEVLLVFEPDDDAISIHAVLVEGCLSGYRRLDLDLETGEVEADDAESDADDATDLADFCYAALADVIFGPVDFADAWSYEQEHELYRQKATTKPSSSPAETGLKPSSPLQQNDEAPATPKRTILPSDAVYAEWKTLSRPSVPTLLGTEESAAFTLMCSANSAARNLAATLRNADASDPVNAAALRLARAASETGSMHALESPSIPDGVTLTGLEPATGLLVIRDTAFFESVDGNLIQEGHQSPAKAVCILYHISTSGLSALALQLSDEREMTFARWVHGPLDARETDDDAFWYIRGCLYLALDGHAVEPLRTAPDTLPHMQSRVLPDPEGFRQGPRRVVAQARLQPESMSIALATIIEWFDEQIDRHGDALIADLREEGDWTIEHIGRDKANGTASLWSVTVRTTPTSPATIDIIVQTTLATGVKPRLPTLIRRIAERTPTHGPDGQLEFRPRYVNGKGAMLDLVRLLQSPERTLPVFIMTQDDQGQYTRDPQEVAAQVLGAATVVKVSAPMTYDMSDMLGQEYRTFYGAVGVFQPGFDPDGDGRRHYYRIMPDTTSDRALASAITLATAATVTRYNIDPPVRHHSTNEPSKKLTRKPLELGRRPQAKPVDEVAPTPEKAVREPLKLHPKPEAPEPAIIAEPEVNDALAASPKEESDKQASAPAPTIAEPEAETSPAEQNPEDSAEPVSSTEEQGEAQAEVEPGPIPAPAPSAPSIDPNELATLIANVVDQRLTSLGIADIGSQLGGILDHLKTMPTAALPQTEAEEEIEMLRAELRREREAQTELLEEADAERHAATIYAQTLRQALNDQRRLAYAKDAPEYPENLSGLSEWLDRNVLPNVVITSKAWRAMRKVDYRDMERLCETLKLLDTAYFDMRAGEDGAREAWETGLQDLRLQDKKQGRFGGAKQDDYQFTHEGQTYFMDKHLRGAESLYNDHTRLLRLYYTWDEDQRRVLIGHMPTHLTTKDS